MPTPCRFRLQPSDVDGFEDGLEGVGAGAQPCRIDDGANVSLALGRPHRTIAVGHFALDDGRPKLPEGTEIELWWADEARIGQKNKVTRRWARRGTRPSAPSDQRTMWAYIFGAICPKKGKGVKSL